MRRDFWAGKGTKRDVEQKRDWRKSKEGKTEGSKEREGGLLREGKRLTDIVEGCKRPTLGVPVHTS